MDGLPQILVGRGDDPRVGGAGGAVADPLEGLLLQHPEKLDLEVKRKIADFVQKDSAARGQLEPADPVPYRTSEGTAHMTKELALQQLARKSPTIDRYKWTLAAGRVDVNGPSHELLAGTALTTDQNRGIALRQVLDQPKDVQHGRRAGDQSGKDGRRRRTTLQVLLAKSNDDDIGDPGVADRRLVMEDGCTGDRDQPGRHVFDLDRRPPAFTALAGLQSLAYGAVGSKEVGPEHLGDMFAGDRLDGSLAHQVIESRRGTNNPEIAIEADQRPAERLEDRADPLEH
jgi:hypothetical protein